MSICKRCGRNLLREDFRQLRKQKNGICKACEFKAKFVLYLGRPGEERNAAKFKRKHEAELRAQERRADAYWARARECRLQLLPDD